MITERQAELLRELKRGYGPRCDDYLTLEDDGFAERVCNRMYLSPAGRAALAEFDAAQLEGAANG